MPKKEIDIDKLVKKATGLMTTKKRLTAKVKQLEARIEELEQESGIESQATVALKDLQSLDISSYGLVAKSFVEGKISLLKELLADDFS